MKIKLLIALFFLQLSHVIIAQNLTTKTSEYTANVVTFVEKKHVLTITADSSILEGDYLLLEKSQKPYGSDNKPFAEDSMFNYFVLQQGVYQQNKKVGKWLESFGLAFYRTGLYENGEKTGEWEEFHGRHLCGIGSYSKNKKVGIWTYNTIQWTKEKDIYLKYDYDKDSILMIVPTKLVGFRRLDFRAYDTRDSLISNTMFPYGDFNVFYLPIWGRFGGFASKNTPQDILGTFSIYVNIDIDSIGIARYSIKRVSNDKEGAIQKAAEWFIQQIPIEWIPARTKKGSVPSQTLTVVKLSLCG